MKRKKKKVLFFLTEGVEELLLFSSIPYSEKQIQILNVVFIRLSSFLEFATTKKIREHSLNSLGEE